MQYVLQHFPSAAWADSIVASTRAVLYDHGFTADNTIACVCTCRDELTRGLHRAIHGAWGEAFNFSSLGGMVLLGHTGFNAALAHAPTQFDRERYVFVAAPHIGLDPERGLGYCRRPGRAELSPACGALAATAAHFAKTSDPGELDPEDLELSLIRRRLGPLLTEGEHPATDRIVELAQQAAQSDLERLIEQHIDPDHADWAVISGIQIHAPHGEAFALRADYAVVSGKRFELGVSKSREILRAV